MKDIQSLIQRYTIAYGALLIVSIALMTIPVFAGFREAVAAKVGMTPQVLWVPVSGFLLLALFGSYKRLSAIVAKPINDLAHHIREGESSGYNFQKKSRNKEEVVLKGYIQSHDLKVSEIKEQRDELEFEFKNARDERDIALSLNNRQASELAELDALQKELRVRTQTLTAANEVLEKTLTVERKSKVGREVQMRAEEIYAQVERAVSEASARAIWIPQLISQIETPTALINELSNRLESNWREISLSRLGEEIAEIRQQSDLQCALLGSVDREGLLPLQTPQEKSGPPLEIEHSTPYPGDMLIGDSIALDRTEELDRSEENTETSESSPAEIEAGPIDLESPQKDKVDAVKLEAERPEKNEEAVGTTIETHPERSNSDHPLNENTPVDSNELEIIEPTSQPDLKTLSALQALVFELVQEYSQEVDKISVDADFADDLDVEVDEELLESVLSNLLEIAIYQWKEGSVKLKVSRQDNQITFAVESKGKPLSYGELDDSQSNRIASALDRKIDVDMPSEGELRMRYRYTPESV